MTESQDQNESIESKTIKMNIPKPRHIIFKAKSGVYFGKGQTL